MNTQQTNTPKFAFVKGRAIQTTGTIKNAYMCGTDESREKKRRQRNAAKGVSEPEFVSMESMREKGVVIPSADDVAEIVARKIINQQLHKAVDELSAKRMEVIRLRYFEGLSVRETAVVLKVSAGTVQHHEKKALEELGGKVPNPYED